MAGPIFPLNLQNAPVLLQEKPDYFYPCAWGILGQPDGEYDGDRYIAKDPVYKNAAPKLGEEADQEQKRAEEEENQEDLSPGEPV